MNKVFIWEYLENVTRSYHSEGGLVVLAESLERAIELAQENGVVFSEEELTPDVILSSDSEGEYVHIFPDAGCC
jgi:hypothetical protein